MTILTIYICIGLVCVCTIFRDPILAIPELIRGGHLDGNGDPQKGIKTEAGIKIFIALAIVVLCLMWPIPLARSLK